ncbi:cytochrome P450 [Trametopsis cervina]|nr:cytochrome P450 [Trametopsis cervina]
MALIYFFGLSFVCAVVGVLLRRNWRPARRLPPGPPAHPILGHLRVIPPSNVRAETFYEWSRQYGDVISLSVFGKTIVVLNSEKAASELLDQRSAIYSDRPSFPIFERIGWKDGVTFLPYGPEFIHQRRYLQQSFAKSEVQGYRHIHEEEISVFLKNLLEDPQDFDRYAHQLTTGAIINLTYGHRVRSHDDEYFAMTERFQDFLRDGLRSSLLDISPIFGYLPGWFPGAWFVNYIAASKPIIKAYIENPLQAVRDQMAAGKAPSCFASQHLEAMSREGRETPEELRTLAIVSHLIVGGGTESTWHTITVFFICMLLNPEVQAKARAEIDAVVGRGRLPDFTDRDSLPYLDCILHETMRRVTLLAQWFPAAQLGVPHKVMTDDYYEGMYIPKGATVIANSRSITWDEKRFHQPSKFIPERFLPKPQGYGETPPIGAYFGWGRRMCPGRHFADRTLWLTFARLLAVFDICKLKNAEGHVLEPEIKFVTGIASHPEPFPCDIRPRDEHAIHLIREAYMMTASS